MGSGNSALKKGFTLTEAYVFCLISVLAGSTFLALKIAVTEIPPFFLNGIRGISAGILVLFFLFFVEEARFSFKDKFRIVIVSLLRRSIPFVCFSFAVIPLSSSLLAVVVASIPLWSFLIKFIVGKKYPSRAQVGGLFVGIVGISYISIPTAEFSLPIWALIIAVIGAISSTTGSLITKEGSESPFYVLGFELVFSGIFLFSISLFLGEDMNVLSRISLNAWLALVFLVVFHGFFGQIAHLWIMKLSGSSEGLLYLYASTPIAMILGYLVADEKIALGHIFSSLLVLSSVYLIRIKKQ